MTVYPRNKEGAFTDRTRNAKENQGKICAGKIFKDDVFDCSFDYYLHI